MCRAITLPPWADALESYLPNLLPHLTLGQVFDALSYYSENQEEINEYIQRNRIPDDLIDPLVRDM